MGSSRDEIARKAVARPGAKPKKQQPVAERLLALHRAMGNAALATRRPLTRAMLQRGRLSGSLEFLETKWDDFSEHTDEIRDTLFDDFGPMLEEHTKAAGMTKKKSKATPLSGLKFDPDKEKAVNVAHGLEEWLTSASEGAERYYAEMRQALDQLGGVGLDWQFGVSDIYQPDAFTFAGRSFESKRTRNDSPSAVDTLIREARYQSTQRVQTPEGVPFTTWNIAIEIAADNPWPYTPTELKKAGITAADVPKHMLNSPHLLPKPASTRIKARNLTPQKSTKKAKIPGAQAGKHKLVVTWLGANVTHTEYL